MTVVAGSGSVAMSSGPARGVVFIHSVPRAVSPHLEWALAKIFGANFSVDWADQPIAPGSVRAEIIWTGAVGTGARVASALLAFAQARYEVTEDASVGREGERFVATPNLGLHRSTIGVHGDVMVHEDRIRSLIHQSAMTGESPVDELQRLIGTPWDEEIEPFRAAHADSTVRVLHAVV